VKLTSKTVENGSRPLELGDRLSGVSILGMNLSRLSSFMQDG
jgi:hypothetical protein